jgi:LysM repeat protein
MRTFVLGCLALIFACSNSFAQSQSTYDNAPVTISSEKVRMGGKLFYSHIVLEKQTLFSISKTYNVSVQDIYDNNPGVKENGLKKGVIILIPVVDPTAAPAPTPTAIVNPTPTVKEEEPKVAPKEEKTAEVKEEKKVEMKVSKEPSVQMPKDKFKLHTVKWYEDLEAIASKYDCSQESIIAINQLPGKKLSIRQKIWVPKSKEVEAEFMATLEAKAEQEKEEAVVEQAPEKTVDIAEQIVYSREDTVKFAMLLPLNASSNISSGNMDFYSGALLALRKAGKEGLNVDLSIYDVNAKNMNVSSQALSRADLIIGPVSSAEIKEAMLKNTDSTYMVSPLDPRVESLIPDNPLLIQAPSSVTSQHSDLLTWVAQDRKPEDKFIVIFEKGSRELLTDSMIKNQLAASGLEYSTLSYNILEGREVTESLKKLMNETAVNRFLIASDKEAFVNDVVRNLNVLIHEKYNVVLYAPSKIRSFETIEIDNFHNTNMHCSLSYYVDYNSKEVKEFLMTYRALYNAEPSPFAFQGYDIVSHFVKLINTYKENWKEYMPVGTSEMLQSDFRFKKFGEGQGWINTGIRRIIYQPNYQVEFIR